MIDLEGVLSVGVPTGGSGTNDYEQLNNKPSINSVELDGNKTGADLGLVDQEAGKGLSTNDFTNAEKEKLASLENYDDTEIQQNIADLETNKANNSDLSTVATSGSYNDLNNKPDLSGFITKSVNDLTNYYLKSETYTKEEVTALIGAIQQFHYEVVQELPQTGANNILYLVPKSSEQTNNIYDEYVYANNNWEKIGDTKIDLSNYITTTQLDTALTNYAPISMLNDKVTIVSTDISRENPFVFSEQEAGIYLIPRVRLIYNNSFYYKAFPNSNTYYYQISGLKDESVLWVIIPNKILEESENYQFVYCYNLSTDGLVGRTVSVNNGSTSTSGLSGYFLTINDQDIFGQKTFYNKVPKTNLSPTASNDLTNKNYVDNQVATKQNIIQYSTMPTASEDNLGKIVQYTGDTTDDYINGYFYVCVTDGETTPTYSWKNIQVQDSGGSSNENNFIIKQLFSGPITPDTLQDVGLYVMYTDINHPFSWRNFHNTSVISRTILNGLVYVFKKWKEVPLDASVSERNIGYFFEYKPYYTGEYGLCILQVVIEDGERKLSILNSISTDASNGIIPVPSIYQSKIRAVHTYLTLPETTLNPTNANQFVRKGYADTIPTTYTGYDATKTQVLKNVNGTLTWVDEE